VQSVTAAETTVFVSLQPVRRVFLVLERVVVALLALAAAQGYFDSHNGSSLFFRDLVASASLCPAAARKSAADGVSALNGKQPVRRQVAALYRTSRGLSIGRGNFFSFGKMTK
jgi:hypothetical protein